MKLNLPSPPPSSLRPCATRGSKMVSTGKVENVLHHVRGFQHMFVGLLGWSQVFTSV